MDSRAPRPLRALSFAATTAMATSAIAAMNNPFVKMSPTFEKLSTRSSDSVSL
jgi:hypothetical protein